MRASTAICTKNLVKAFGQNLALKGLNLEIPPGVAGFVGPNGAGKTTTINILLGLLKPDEGEAQIFGLDCWSESFEIRCRIGVLHENPAYPHNFTGERFLEHVAFLYGYSIGEAKQRAKGLLRDVGLLKVANKPIKTYSAGMIRRLGLAKALIGDPEIVILDEPTANIDPYGRIMLLEKIKEMHKDRGMAFLISTHVLPELEKICDWISIIKDGRIVDQGYLNDLAAKYSAKTYRIEVSEPHLFLKEAQKIESVQEAWVLDGYVYCRVKDAESLYREAPKIAAKLNLQLKSFQFLRSSLEEIYKEAICGG